MLSRAGAADCHLRDVGQRSRPHSGTRLLTHDGATGRLSRRICGAGGNQELPRQPCRMYPHLQGMKTNLYKCFITRAWSIGSDKGLLAFLHPEGVYDDPNGGRLRAATVSPARAALSSSSTNVHLFPECRSIIASFSVNVYTCRPSSGISFSHASNLFHPSTVDGQSHRMMASGRCPGIKNEDEQMGHASAPQPLDCCESGAA